MSQLYRFKKIGKYPAILSFHVINNPYFLTPPLPVTEKKLAPLLHLRFLKSSRWRTKRSELHMEKSSLLCSCCSFLCPIEKGATFWGKQISWFSSLEWFLSKLSRCDICYDNFFNNFFLNV